MTARFVAVLLVAFLASFGGAMAYTDSIAHAQQAPARSREQRGRIHFESGQAYFEDGDYERALAEYQSAFDLTARPSILVNLALCLEQLGRLEEALDDFERFLASGVRSPLRARAEEKVPELRERIEAAREAAQGTEGAEGAGGAEGEGAGGEGSEGDTVESGNDDVPSPPVRRRRRAHAPELDAPTLDAPEVLEPEPDMGRIAAHATLFSLAGVGLITGAVLGFLTLAEDASLKDGCGMTGRCTSSELSDIRTFRLGADLAFFGSFVSALAGSLMILLGPPEGEQAAHDTASASLRVAPFVNDTAAGLVAAGRL